MWKLRDTLTDDEGMADTPGEVGTLLREWFKNAPDDHKNRVDMAIYAVEIRLREGEDVSDLASYLAVKIDAI